MSYEVVVSGDVMEFLRAMDEKSRRICKKNLEKLSHPYPGRGTGDKERIVVEGEGIYRLHIGRTYTAFYVVDERSRCVRVVELLPIREAHRGYGY